jgi:hypothetical protein
MLLEEQTRNSRRNAALCFWRSRRNGKESSTCQRWGVTLPSTDMTQCCWLGNHGRLEDTKPLEEVVRWQRGDNKIYVSRVISAAPAEQHQAAPAEQQGIAAATEGIV